MSTVYFPAYKDTYYETYSTSLSYYIETGGQIVFEGKAVRGPSGKLRVNINKILKDYIENTIADFRNVDGQVLPQPEAFKLFELKNQNNGEVLATYGVLFDWEGEWNGETKVLSDPIRKRISSAIKFPISVYSPSGETIVLSSGKITHSTYFHNLTPAIVFAYTGGTAQIIFDTDFEPISSISVSATTSGYTFSNITPTSVTVTAAPNTSAEDRSGYIIFLFEGNDLGWGRTYVDTLRSGSTPVTGITWLSGDTVHRDCWSTVPFEEELRVPNSFGQGVMTADFSGAECGEHRLGTFLLRLLGRVAVGRIPYQQMGSKPLLRYELGRNGEGSPDHNIQEQRASNGDAPHTVSNGRRVNRTHWNHISLQVHRDRSFPFNSHYNAVRQGEERIDAKVRSAAFSKHCISRRLYEIQHPSYGL